MVYWEDALQVLAVSSVPLAKGLYIEVMIIFVLRPIEMLDVLGTNDINNYHKVLDICRMQSCHLAFLEIKGCLLFECGI